MLRAVLQEHVSSTRPLQDLVLTYLGFDLVKEEDEWMDRWVSGKLTAAAHTSAFRAVKIDLRASSPLITMDLGLGTVSHVSGPRQQRTRGALRNVRVQLDRVPDVLQRLAHYWAHGDLRTKPLACRLHFYADVRTLGTTALFRSTVRPGSSAIVRLKHADTVRRTYVDSATIDRLFVYEDDTNVIVTIRNPHVSCRSVRRVSD